MVADVPEAVALGEKLAIASGTDEVVVIGGGQYICAGIADVHRILLTEVHGDIEGDTKFPVLNDGEWREVSRDKMPRGDKDSADTSFVVLERNRL